MPGPNSSRIIKFQLQNHKKVKGFPFSEGSGEVSGNWGLLDQVAALTWVQTHIGAFGGDPRRVAMAADRGGADLAGIHLLTTGAGDSRLFRRALLMVSDPLCLHLAAGAGQARGPFSLEASWLPLLGSLILVLSVHPAHGRPQVHVSQGAEGSLVGCPLTSQVLITPDGAFCFLGVPH